jgi:hypothetical protein
MQPWASLTVQPIVDGEQQSQQLLSVQDVLDEQVGAFCRVRAEEMKRHLLCPHRCTHTITRNCHVAGDPSSKNCRYDEESGSKYGALSSCVGCACPRRILPWASSGCPPTGITGSGHQPSATSKVSTPFPSCAVTCVKDGPKISLIRGRLWTKPILG